MSGRVMGTVILLCIVALPAAAAAQVRTLPAASPAWCATRPGRCCPASRWKRRVRR